MSENFGKRLTIIRIERGLKQCALADKIGIDAALLSNYEKGKVKPTLTTLEWICKALDMTATELCGF